MNSSLSQYYQRAPRYILLPQDKCFVRVAGPKQTPWEETTEIQNISQTGLSFSAPNILLPRLGENIRIQFEVTGSRQMACYAKVVRMEQRDSENSLVAVEFESMNSAQKLNLYRGLKGKTFNDNEKENVLEHPLSFGGENFKAPRWMLWLFFMSVGLSLYLSAYLLFALFQFLSDPNWIDKITLIAKTLFSML